MNVKTLPTDHLDSTSGLVALKVKSGADSMNIYFATPSALLQTKKLLADALPQVLAAEDMNLRILMADPNEAVDLVTLWYEGLGGARAEPTEEPDVNAGTKAEQLIALIKRPEGVSVQELVDRFGVKPKSATARISVETRKRGLHAVITDGRYHVAA